jgi:hypothetical protein
MTIDSKQATEALNEIDAVVRAVRQSRVYNIASLILMMWGPLIALGYVLTYASPRHAGYTWLAIDTLGIAATFAIGALSHARAGVRGFDYRMLVAIALLVAFGLLWSIGLVHFPPRQLNAFWSMYFMLVYSIVGLWFGWAFVAIGLGIIALTLIGFFYSGQWFELWMATVNGGGLILGGLWMRRS